jgi:hypothetical protein
MSKPYAVKFLWSFAPHDVDLREYTFLSKAIRGITQGLNPEPDGRGCVGAKLFARALVSKDGEVEPGLTRLGYAEPDSQNGWYWVDITEAGAGFRLADIKIDKEETL